MNRNISYTAIRTLIFSLLIILSGCESNISTENGLLDGIISIGPICPVETVPPLPECLPTAETYKAYPVGIYTSDGMRMVTQIAPALDGSFSVELFPGQYLIKQEKKYGIGGSNLPMKVVVNNQEKTTILINIDTGIR